MRTFHIEQFGCRATQADGAAIERQLREQGCLPAEDLSRADVVVLNTCTVTAAADAQARDAIRKIHAANPATRIIVTGCYAQRAPEEIAALAGVSFVVGNSHKPKIPDLVREIAPSALVNFPIMDRTPDRFAPFHSAPIFTGDIFEMKDVLVAPVLGGEGNHTRPTLKIQDGCNSRCSFCIIPFVRGKSRSLSPESVLREVRKLAEAGYLEIVLSGINLGSYGRDLNPRVEFLDLLRRILGETEVQSLRLSSIEPLDVNQDLIDLFASSDRVARHFHMPLQSASDRILAAMHRWYRADHYSRRVEMIRDCLPDAAIGADVITGFPGETEADHAATLRFIEERPFTYLHVFSYSQRPSTKAAQLPWQVPGHVIKRRARELRAVAEIKSAAFRATQLGRIVRAITLNPSEGCREGGVTPALTSNYLQVHLPVALPANQFVDVRISGNGANVLFGEVVAVRRFEAASAS